MDHLDPHPRTFSNMKWRSLSGLVSVLPLLPVSSNQSGIASTIPLKRRQNSTKSISSGYQFITKHSNPQICRDFESFEWFRSLLAAIEAQDIGDLIEIHTYLTQRVKEADAINIMVNDAGAEVDAITGLKAPTNFGRPNWDR